jgi:hypothetical protein
MEGVCGGRLACMVKSSGRDQADDEPLLSVAIAFIWYVPAEVHLWDDFMPNPELTSDVTDFVPSPQSNVYFTLSPSASLADVVKL